jgi:hypothetical protein
MSERTSCMLLTLSKCSCPYIARFQRLAASCRANKVAPASLLCCAPALLVTTAVPATREPQHQPLQLCTADTRKSLEILQLRLHLCYKRASPYLTPTRISSTTLPPLNQHCRSSLKHAKVRTKCRTGLPLLRRSPGSLSRLAVISKVC